MRVVYSLRVLCFIFLTHSFGFAMYQHDHVETSDADAEGWLKQGRSKRHVRRVGKATNAQSTISNLRIVNNPEIYISLTTSPERMENLEPMLNYLLLGVDYQGKAVQGQKGLIDSVKQVFLNVPKYYRNDPKSPYDAEELERLQGLYNGKLIVNIIDIDLGPITKVLPTARILKEKGKTEAVIVSLDDDHYYHPSSIKHLLYLKRRNPSCILSFGGGALDHYEMESFEFPGEPVREITNQKQVGIISSNISTRNGLIKCYSPNERVSLQPREFFDKGHGYLVDVVEGQGAIAYSVGQFDDELLALLSTDEVTCKDCRLSDDIVLSFVLAYANIDRIKLRKNIDSLKRSKSTPDLDAIISDPNYEFAKLTNSGALTQGSGYNRAEMAERGIRSHGNNDPAKYKRAIAKLNEVCMTDDGYMERSVLLTKLRDILSAHASEASSKDDGHREDSEAN